MPLLPLPVRYELVSQGDSVIAVSYDGTDLCVVEVIYHAVCYDQQHRVVLLFLAVIHNKKLGNSSEHSFPTYVLEDLIVDYLVSGLDDGAE
jgi:hypothetical protein